MNLVPWITRRKAITVFQTQLKRKLSDDWGNKSKYSASQVSDTIQQQFPRLCRYQAYAIYMWAGKAQLDNYAADNGLTICSMDIRRHISSTQSVLQASTSDSGDCPAIDSPRDSDGG